MGLIIVVGHFDIHPDDTAAVAELMRTMVTETVKEEGCQHYAFSADLLDQNRFQLSELWESAETLEAHSRTAHMAAFRAGLANLRVEARLVKRYEAISVSNL